jgi:hypothetical protein
LLGGLSVVPLMIHPCQLGYTGPYLGTLRSSWDHWWLLLEGVHNPRGNLKSLASYSLSQLGGYSEEGNPRCCPPCQTFGLTGGCKGLLPMGGWYGQLTHFSHTKVQKWMGFSGPVTRGMGFLVPYSVKIPLACLVTGYVPATWRQIKVVFIPKPSRNSYG